MIKYENHTFSNDFILLGLFTFKQVWYSSLYIHHFILTVTENTVMILIIRRELRLHTPMYFLLSHLSFYGYFAYFQHCSQNDHWLSVRQQNDFICSLWLQIFLSLTSWVVSAFSWQQCPWSCYVAICHPLRYPILMND